MRRRALLASLALLPLAAPLMSAPEVALAAKIGENTPFPPLTAERISTLPAAERAGWLEYLKRSDTQKEADKQALRAERKGLSVIPEDPKGGHDEDSMPLKQPAAWYASEDARLIEANIISFQTPAGGWGKNQSRQGPLRQKGQAFVYGSASKYIVKGDFDTPADPNWSYVGTIDNGATTTEIRFLAKVATATGEAAPKAAAIRGLNYLLAAQFPNGGWPQVWPLQGGYHDGVTLNDDAMISVIALIGDAADGEGDFAFVPADLRKRLSAAETAGIDALLKSQVVLNGKPSLWAQQYDALTLMPASARNFEPPSLSTSESASVLVFLMKQPKPSPAMRAAIENGVAMISALKIEGKAFVKVSETEGRRLTDKPGSVIWSRYYDPKTLKPVFGDRDRGVYDAIDDISLERRNGYSWFNNSAQKAIDAFAKWKAKNG
ncbi:MAG: pectate lyase [Asticcacaulis sp.]